MRKRPLNGDVAILADVSGSVIDPHMCYLLIHHGGRACTGELWFDDVDSCKEAYQRLKRNRGRPINDIADLFINTIEASNEQ